MTQEEYERQRNDVTNRFRVFNTRDLASLGLCEESKDDGVYWLVEFAPGKAPRIVSRDGGEPEDQSLMRDWSWVAGALNRAYNDGWGDAAAYSRKWGVIFP